jgi:hypothetical protein
MKSLLKNNTNTLKTAAQCCAKTSQNVAGCHD